MATVWLSKDQHADVMLKRIYDRMRMEKARLRMSEKKLGEVLGYSQQVTGNHLNNCMTIKDLIMMIDLFELDDETILKLLKMT